MLICELEKGKVSCSCDGCGKELNRLKKNRKKTVDLCSSCRAKKRCKEHPLWQSEEAKTNRKASISKSEAYKKSHSDCMSGEKNHRFGTKASAETREKMTASRTGKKQSTETIKKRVETTRARWALRPIRNLCATIKQRVNAENNWSRRVLGRDEFQCKRCGSSVRLDAHHKEPISKLVKRLLENLEFADNREKFNYLITLPEILDEDLDNGTTLCRKCHRQLHNWGSHNA